MWKIVLAALLLLGLVCEVDAASRFWNPYIVTGAISGTAGVCRLTISPAITGNGLVGGEAVSVTGVSGATGCNVDATVSTVVDSTHIEITGTTFGGAYTSGGCVGGGNWTATNTSNWAASSTATCGSGGQTVPGLADTATFDANSLSGTITVNTTVNVLGITTGALTGAAGKAVLDFSANNNNVTLAANGWNNSGTGTRTVNTGAGTWTLNSGGSWVQSTVTGLTFTTSAAFVINMTANTAVSFLQGTAGTYASSTFSVVGAAGSNFTIATSGNMAITSLSVTAPGRFSVQNGNVLTVTNAISASGASLANLIEWGGSSIAGSGTTGIASANNGIFTWSTFRDLAFTGGGTFTATNSINLGHNSGIAITNPSLGHVIGGS